MKPGLYDDLVTQNLIHEIERLKTDGVVPLFGKVEPAQLPDYLTRFLAAQLAKAIRWQLPHPMPTAHYREARLVSGMED